MASFAKLGANGEVLEVVAVDNSVIKNSNGIEQENLGISYLTELYNWPVWKQTSYNTIGGVHTLGGKPFRKNHAGIGGRYDSDRDAFIPKKSYASWVLNEETCQWEAPITMPELTQEQIDNKNSYSCLLYTSDAADE